jgi:hypothetical protein
MVVDAGPATAIRTIELVPLMASSMNARGL